MCNDQELISETIYIFVWIKLLQITKKDLMPTREMGNSPNQVLKQMKRNFNLINHQRN